ncbi:hypothetical protein M501DRAFT_917575, partial [Patellaria atrata CBS 101060]
QRPSTLPHNVSLALLILCPTIALLPPRKLDLYTFSLSGIWLLSANHLTKDYTHRSILQHLSRTGRGANADGRGGMGMGILDGLPTERAREVQRVQMRAKEEREKALRELGEGQEKKEDGVLEKIWMGGEKKGWRERRLEEERKAIEEGRGYGSLIMEQIWEVFEGKGGIEGGKDEEDKNE